MDMTKIVTQVETAAEDLTSGEGGPMPEFQASRNEAGKMRTLKGILTRYHDDPTVEKPVIFAGRNYNPARDDEAVVTPRFVATTLSNVPFFQSASDVCTQLLVPTARAVAQRLKGFLGG